MSVRWILVQYVGDTLRLPIVNQCDMDKPLGVSRLERHVGRIVVNPFGDSVTFVPERTAKRVNVPYRSHVSLGHYECGACGQVVDEGDKFCKQCGAGLEDE
jgi:hypothetical protein